MPKGKTAAQLLGANEFRNLSGLISNLRARRIVSEATHADTIVMQAPDNAPAGSNELQAVAALNLGNAASFVEGNVVGRAKPRMQVMRSWDDTVVVKANASALAAMRVTSPGLRIFQSTYLYPQYIKPLGAELETAGLEVAAGPQPKTFTVKLVDSGGSSIQGVLVKALLDWNGAHVKAETDASGLAKLSLPKAFPKVVMLTVEPHHTYWSQYLNGFVRASAPRQLVVELRELLPDSFELFKHYAPYDETAGAGVTVGVIDCGVGPHKALKVAGGACLVTGESATQHKDNGLGHGTHVAGTIAAKRLLGTNVYGLAPACKLMAYRVCPNRGDETERGRATSTDVAAAIERAIGDGCDLINISMGSTEAMPEVPAMLEKARAAGVVVLAATGNDGLELLRYPGRYSLAVAVGAHGRDETIPENCPEIFHESDIRRKSEFVAEFSNHGVGTDLIGPGVAVLSTFPGHRYAMMSGTSMSTPYSTGMAARILAHNVGVLAMPKDAARSDAIVQMLSVAAMQAGWPDGYSGFGMLK